MYLVYPGVEAAPDKEIDSEPLSSRRNEVRSDTIYQGVSVMVARLDRVVRLYGRYGPSRLPLGDRQDVGAGYSMAAGVLAGGIVFAPVSTLVSGTVGSAG